MSKDHVENPNEPIIPNLQFADFLVKVPPHSAVIVNDFKMLQDSNLKAKTPPIAIHCPESSCVDRGTLLHRCVANDENISGDSSLYTYLYQCPNCQKKNKTFVIKVLKKINHNGPTSLCLKVGEHPNFGPTIPSRLLNTLGKERELFLKGRRCEVQGLGIAAFSYYRRVIENQKNKIFDEIIKVTKLLEADSHLIEELESAKNETQFTKSIYAIKAGLPQTLFIRGENPLTLLHGALSEGLHAKSDEECLQIAGNIRVVLTALTQNIQNALNDDKELANAVKGLKQLRVKA